MIIKNTVPKLSILTKIKALKNMTTQSQMSYVSTLKFSRKIIINLINNKIMNIKISKLKINPFHFKISHTNENNDLVGSIKELNTGKDPPADFPFRSVKMKENSIQK